MTDYDYCLTEYMDYTSPEGQVFCRENPYHKYSRDQKFDRKYQEEQMHAMQASIPQDVVPGALLSCDPEMGGRKESVLVTRRKKTMLIALRGSYPPWFKDLNDSDQLKLVESLYYFQNDTWMNNCERRGMKLPAIWNIINQPVFMKEVKMNTRLRNPVEVIQPFIDFVKNEIDKMNENWQVPDWVEQGTYIKCIVQYTLCRLYCLVHMLYSISL